LSLGLLPNYQAIAKSNNEPKMFIKSSISGAAVEAEEPDSAEYLETTDREQIAGLFRETLERTRPKELERGITLVGPHRDDLVLDSWQFASKRLRIAR
jgi:DNA replication and repair protein RecF